MEETDSKCCDFVVVTLTNASEPKMLSAALPQYVENAIWFYVPMHVIFQCEILKYLKHHDEIEDGDIEVINAIGPAALKNSGLVRTKDGSAR